MAKTRTKSSIHQKLFDVGFFLVILWAIFNIWLNLGYVCTEIKVNSVDNSVDPPQIYVVYNYNGQLKSNVEMPNYTLTEDEQSTGKKFYAYLSKSNDTAWVNRNVVEILHFIILPGLLLLIIGYCFDEKNLERIQDRNTQETVLN